MIFERFFTPKHKSKDVDVRLLSIDKLDADKATDKQILHELAFNDSSPRVILKALDALKSFPLWQKAAEQSEHKSVKNHAQALVLNELENPQSELISEQAFYDFCAELKNTILLEKIVLNNKRLQANDALALSCLSRINKENVSRLYFKQSASHAQRMTLIDTSDELSNLTKFLKFDLNEVEKTAVETKIKALKDAEQKPLAIKQQVSLVTSKLLASKELSDYEIMLSSQKELVSEFDRLKQDFSVLKEEQAYELTAKFLSVNESVEKRLKDLKSAWEQNQVLAQTTNEIAEIEEQVNQVLTQIDVLSLEQNLQDIKSQSKILSLSLQDASSSLVRLEGGATTPAHQQWIKRLLAKLDSQQKTLSNLPSIHELNTLAKSLLEKQSDLLEKADTADDPQSIQVIESALKELKDTWKTQVLMSENSISESLQQAWSDVNKALNKCLKKVRDEQEKLRKQTFNKLKTVQRLIDQGKFKSAIASYRYAQDHYQDLAESSRSQVDTIYQDISAKINELQELQAFIAAPRKPALLEEIKALASEAADNIKERTAQVKHYRAQWLSLGKLDTDEDKALNKEFDTIIELAFKPCREYFAHQESIRSSNKTLALKLIEQVHKLEQIENDAELAKAHSNIQKQFRALGQLEHNDYKALHTKFKDASKPVSERIDVFYKQNEHQKSTLVKKAAALLEHEDLLEASKQAKHLQSTWKSIGYAGKKQDDGLWKQFRQHNDTLFARLNAQKTEQHSINQSKVTQTSDMLDSLQAAIDKATSLSELRLLEQGFADIEQSLDEVAARQRKSLESRFEKLKDAIDLQLKHFNNADKLKAKDAFFSVLAEWTEDTYPASLETLQQPYKNWFLLNQQSTYDRHQLTIIAEIICEHDSIKADVKARKALQLELMARKLEGKDIPSIDKLVAQWVSKGPIADGESSLMKRLKKVYCQLDASNSKIVKQD